MDICRPCRSSMARCCTAGMLKVAKAFSPILSARTWIPGSTSSGGTGARQTPRPACVKARIVTPSNPTRDDRVGATESQGSRADGLGSRSASLPQPRSKADLGVDTPLWLFRTQFRFTSARRTCWLETSDLCRSTVSPSAPLEAVPTSFISNQPWREESPLADGSGNAARGRSRPGRPGVSGNASTAPPSGRWLRRSPTGRAIPTRLEPART